MKLPKVKLPRILRDAFDRHYGRYPGVPVVHYPTTGSKYEPHQGEREKARRRNRSW